MPKRPSPTTLREECLKAVATHLELLSYGCPKGSAELRDLIETEDYVKIKGALFRKIVHKKVDSTLFNVFPKLLNN